MLFALPNPQQLGVPVEDLLQGPKHREDLVLLSSPRDKDVLMRKLTGHLAVHEILDSLDLARDYGV
jgi:hypothetical protein